MEHPYPRLALEDWCEYTERWPLTERADFARELVRRSAIDAARATEDDLVAAIDGVTQNCSPTIADGLRALTLADLHDGAAAHLAERLERVRAHERRRRRYPRAGRIVAQQRWYAVGLRRRQRDHHVRAHALSGRQRPILASVPRGTRPRGAGRPPAVAARRSSSRGGDGGDGDPGPEGPSPARGREHHPLADRQPVVPQQDRRSPSPTERGQS